MSRVMATKIGRPKRFSDETSCDRCGRTLRVKPKTKNGLHMCRDCRTVDPLYIEMAGDIQ